MTGITEKPLPNTSLARWREALDAILARLEQVEMSLAQMGAGRRDSGSYYTPADVAGHFWRLFWRHHGVDNGAAATEFLNENTFVEPSVGSGIFIFSMLRSLTDFEVGPSQAASVKLVAVDINGAALSHVREELASLEVGFSVCFSRISFEHRDFLDWAAGGRGTSVTFVGNPPFVGNAKGSRWKNLYADFVEAMLTTSEQSSVSLILPVSVCFSRDYVRLRQLLKQRSAPLSASSYDNMPDYLFKAGKPESGNTNKANSQRCTILNVGGPRTGIVESSALLRWSSSGRADFLSSTPKFHDCAGFDIERQIPRPSDASLSEYLHEADGSRTVRELMSRIGKGAFAVGGVARNFIGIRDYDAPTTGVTPVRTNERDSTFILLQVLSSDIFYKYWRSFGDGFHVTTDLIDRFPISKRLMLSCEENLDAATSIWKRRADFAKEKLNSGKVVRSYDFSGAFAAI